MKTETGYIVFAHGSRVESANDAVRRVAGDFSRREGGSPTEAAFLEGGTPDLGGAVAALAGRGVKNVVVLPYFLTLGTHMQRDLPKLVERALADHPGITITVAPPLDGHPALLDALADRAAQFQGTAGERTAGG
jgi:sirohydrochlorin ferrochelatase